MPSKEFEFTGGWQRWNVPDKVEWVDVVLTGAGSGRSRGGRVSGRINVKRIDSLHIFVGERGSEDGAATAGQGGRGGDGHPGGWSGGGASYIRARSRTGALKAVAGGAGGRSGDGGRGGDGGSDDAEAGLPGDLATGETGNATGGTQVQGGNGGTSSFSEALRGSDAPDGALGRGGAGGGTGAPGTAGGGGGGGGFRSGGGGQAGMVDATPGGGGGGGSSFRGGLVSFSSELGGGGRGHGSVTLQWVTPPPANQPPAPPTEVKVSGKDASEAMVTHARNRVTIGAKVSDPDNKQRVRMIVVYSPDFDFRQSKQVASEWVEAGKRTNVVLSGLSQNTLYHLRLYTRDRQGLISTNFRKVTFWTNRSPGAPRLVLPLDNGSVSELDSTLFQWQHNDPDDPQVPQQRAFRIRWRRAGTPLRDPGEWHQEEFATHDETFVLAPGQLGASYSYEWRVRTQDAQGAWGPWSDPRSFFVTGDAAPPLLDHPVKGEAIEVAKPITFDWTFVDPQGRAQHQADLRYRAVGTESWFTILGTDSLTEHTLPADTLQAGINYEWQVRTQVGIQLAMSAWSESETFWSIKTPGIGGRSPIIVPSVTGGELGCGENVVHIYDRGGLVYRGEIKPLASLRYNRRRDDISNCVLVTNGFDEDCGTLLETVHCWTHEIVVFRDGVRVWEGPITRIEDRPDGFEIEAKDVMAYLYRRIMRQGYNDTYRVINGTQVGIKSVVERAVQITVNALAYSDPNLLPYLTSLNYPDDAAQSRSVPDFSKTAWEEVDDLAAHAGLDYTAVGRRVMFWDTHRPIGRLSEMRTANFSSPPVVSEYGMLLATTYGVTNNNGVYGVADMPTGGYGPVEQLASAYGETEASGTEETMTGAARDHLEEVLDQQAARSIAARWPTPLVVRVPDNSQLMPDTNVHFNHLVPGVWIPLRAEGTVRKISQWQKLDQVAVEVTPSGGEKVLVTMSPAPNAGYDPDADAVLEAEE